MPKKKRVTDVLGKSNKAKLIKGYGKVATAQKAIGVAMAASRDFQRKHGKGHDVANKVIGTAIPPLGLATGQSYIIDAAAKQFPNSIGKLKEKGDALNSKVFNYIADKGQPRYESMKNTIKNQLGNDLSWYSNYPEIISTSMGVNFWQPDTQAQYLLGGGFNSLRVPRVAGIRVLLTFGSEANVWNTAISRIYASMRRVNSGAPGFSLGDLTLYIHNFRMILAYWSMLRKAYGLLVKFRVTDPSVPQQYFAAIGLDYDTFADNAVELRMKLNYWAKQLEVYAPYSLDLYKRTSWLFDNVYLDSDDIKAQCYTFALFERTNYYYDYVNSQWSNAMWGGQGVPSPTTTGTPFSFSMTSMEWMITNFCNTKNSQIAGNMLKTYGTANCIKLPYVDENYETPFIYNEEVLTQIQNIDSTDQWSTPIIRSITVDNNTGEVTETLHIQSTSGLLAYSGDRLNTLLNMNHNNITNLDMLGATRFKLDWVKNSSSPITGDLKHWGTEVVADIYVPVVTRDDLGASPNLYSFSSDYHLTNGVKVNIVSTYLTDYEFQANLNWIWSNFDWMPSYMPAISYSLDGGNTVFTNMLGGMLDINNWAILTEANLANFHRVATCSLLYSPLLVKEQLSLTAV